MFLDGYKTYVIAAVALTYVLANGLATGEWNIELVSISALAVTLRLSISRKK